MDADLYMLLTIKWDEEVSNNNNNGDDDDDDDHGDDHNNLGPRVLIVVVVFNVETLIIIIDVMLLFALKPCCRTHAELILHVPSVSTLCFKQDSRLEKKSRF